MTAKIYDRAATMERVDNDVDLLAELVALAFADADAHIPQLRTAAAGGKSAEVVEYAHSLKGAFANVGAGIVASVAGEIEQLARTGRSNEVPPLLTKLEHAIEEYRNVISELIPLQP